MPKKSCHGCVYFMKQKDDRYGPGICDLHDGRVSSSKAACEFFKRAAYNRTKEKAEIKRYDIYGEHIK